MKKILSELLITIIFLGTFLLLIPPKVHAAASLYLSPSSKTVAQGSSFSVAVRVNTGGSKVNAVQVNLKYPTDKLDILSVSTSGSAFEISAENSKGGGSIKIGRGTLTAKSGNLLIATLTFRAKTSSGSATVSSTSGTAVVRSSDNTNILSGGPSGTYSFTKPPPPAPPAPPPPPPDTTAPKISEVKVTATTFKGSTVEWKTDENSTSTVEFGVNTKYGLSAETTGLTKTHKVTVVSEILIPGVTYHFRVKSADASGNAVYGQDGTFKTKGYLVKIKVVDTKGKPVEGVEVTLASDIQISKTDKDGLVSFSDVSPGNHLATVKSAGSVTSTEIVVKEASEAEIAAGTVKEQKFEVKINPKNFFLYYLVLFDLISILILSFGYLGYKRFFSKQFVKVGSHQ